MSRVTALSLGVIYGDRRLGSSSLSPPARAGLGRFPETTAGARSRSCLVPFRFAIRSRAALRCSRSQGNDGSKNQVEDIVKHPIKRKANKLTANRVKGISISDPDYMTMAPVVEPFDGVWSGQIARLRFYDSSQ